KTDDFKALVKDIAMHIAAANPLYLTREEVPTAEIEHEKEILAEQARNEGKPDKIIEKMVVGRIEKYYKEVCLLDQAFVKDQDKTISDLVTANIAKIGENISIRRFARYNLGEGIEKKETDFAAEVMSFVK
ncbi:MAG TPA: translation elongation factor Ts, partial [Candidatus Avacidaminococcus intestinavium]|nr:translation elongation factor Ts [Candidatus Avacidaminococcus intestinavium]